MSQVKICPQCGEEYPLDQRFCPKDGTTLRLQGGGNDLVGSIVADRYHVMRKLGEGGMGQVYLAEHVKMGRKSALKVMNPGMVNDADAISRFNREAANASRISHPNVAAVYDFGETGDGLIYLAMEFVEGPPLTKLIEEQGALQPLRAADITRQTADALSVAHDMGIVHRDLKPDNIMVAKTRDGNDLVKVVDFGIAKAADNAAQKVTKTGLVVGTPEYMSPEQLAGDKLDGRSDIYSLGLVCFNMLTGKLPFPAETVQESMIMRLTDQPKRLQEMKPEMAWPADVQAVLDRALERDAGKRYQQASEFGRDVFRAIERMPISAAAEAGTQVIAAAASQAVPRESVGQAAGGATAVVNKMPSVPATRVSRTADLAVPAPTVPTKSKTPLLAAVAAVVVIGGVGATYFAMRGGAAKVVDTSAATKQVATQNAPAPTPQGTTTTPDAVNLSKQLPPETKKQSGETKSVATPSLDVDGQLGQLEQWADIVSGTPKTARQALSGLDALEGKLTTNGQKVRAGLIRIGAATVLGDSVGACAALTSIKGIAPLTQYSRQVRILTDSTTCK